MKHLNMAFRVCNNDTRQLKIQLYIYIYTTYKILLFVKYFWCLIPFILNHKYFKVMDAYN